MLHDPQMYIRTNKSLKQIDTNINRNCRGYGAVSDDNLNFKVTRKLQIDNIKNWIARLGDLSLLRVL